MRVTRFQTETYFRTSHSYQAFSHHPSCHGDAHPDLQCYAANYACGISLREGVSVTCAIFFVKNFILLKNFCIFAVNIKHR